MQICFDCKKKRNYDGPSWFVDFQENHKIMRCADCGKKEYDRRHEMHFGYISKCKIEDVDKQERIQYAKELREAKLSPWEYREEK